MGATRSWGWLGAVVAAALALAPAPARAANVEGAVDVGVGPAAFLFFGPVFRDQPVHLGLKVSLEAVLDRAWLRRNRRYVPRSYRGLADRVDEVRITPSLLVPDALILSPKFADTGMFGATWRPFSVGLPLVSQERSQLTLSLGVLATYAYLFSDTLPDTHFLRPGADLSLELEVAASRTFLVSFGWQSALYVPQELGSLGFGPLDASLFHVGQAFLKLHFRFDKRVRL